VRIETPPFEKWNNAGQLRPQWNGAIRACCRRGLVERSRAGAGDTQGDRQPPPRAIGGLGWHTPFGALDPSAEPDFLQRYPKIQADLHFSDEPVNIVADGFDLAIRMGEIEDSDLIGRRLT
jgi:DNA-binding transcriptional LysR family regulator